MTMCETIVLLSDDDGSHSGARHFVPRWRSVVCQSHALVFARIEIATRDEARS
jgi:hypothetical protein